MPFAKDCDDFQVISIGFYNAGACLPLLLPAGCRIQLTLVKLLILEEFIPQYLQVYCDFSLPSYNLCLPLFEPNGCRMQLTLVKLLTLDALVPQYSQ